MSRESFNLLLLFSFSSHEAIRLLAAHRPQTVVLLLLRLPLLLLPLLLLLPGPPGTAQPLRSRPASPVAAHYCSAAAPAAAAAAAPLRKSSPFEAVLLPLVEQVRLCGAQVDDFWTPISLRWWA